MELTLVCSTVLRNPEGLELDMQQHGLLQESRVSGEGTHCSTLLPSFLGPAKAERAHTYLGGRKDAHKHSEGLFPGCCHTEQG